MTFLSRLFISERYHANPAESVDAYAVWVFVELRLDYFLVTGAENG